MKRLIIYFSQAKTIELGILLLLLLYLNPLNTISQNKMYLFSQKPIISILNIESSERYLYDESDEQIAYQNVGVYKNDSIRFNDKKTFSIPIPEENYADKFHYYLIDLEFLFNLDSSALKIVLSGRLRYRLQYMGTQNLGVYKSYWSMTIKDIYLKAILIENNEKFTIELLKANDKKNKKIYMRGSQGEIFLKGDNDISISKYLLDYSLIRKDLNEFILKTCLYNN